VPLDFFAQRGDSIERPWLADRNVEEGAHDSAHRWNLPDVREWNRVARPEPSKRDHPMANLFADERNHRRNLTF
jgi:hypothetical protein